MKPITIWERHNLIDKKNKTYMWQFNHIENGLKHGLQPEPHSKLQKSSWLKGTWKRKWGFLDKRNRVNIFMEVRHDKY